MRLKITLNTTLGVRLPRASQEIMHDFILKTADMKNKNYQNFCFSSPKGNFDTNPDKTITYYGDFSFFISSADESFIQAIYDNLEDTVMFNEQEIKLASKDISDFGVKFKNYKIKTISPVTAYEMVDGKTRFYHPENPRFFEIINKNLSEKYRDIKDFKIEFSDVDKVKKIITRYKDFVIEAYQFECKIEGPKDAIKAIYNDGIGNRTFQGFGMCLLGF